MNRFFSLYLLLAALTLLLFSCIESDDDSKTGTSSCVITGFSVGDIKSNYTTKTAAGRDTTYSRTVSGKSIYFNIDQVNNKITSVDSLANWVNLTRVVPTVVGIGTVAYREKGSGNDFSYLNSGSDSINFTNGIELRVSSSDGKYTRLYDVTIKKSLYEIECISWQPMNGNLSLTGNHRTLSYAGKLYVFADNGGTPTLTVGTVSGNDISWTTLAPLSKAINIQSVTCFDGRFFALDAEGTVFSSADGLNWTSSGSTKLERLLTADNFRLYGFDGTTLLSTSDGDTWETEQATQLEALPQMPVSGVSYAMNTNERLENVVMTGVNPLLSNTPVWFKVSAQGSDADQDWHFINISADNPYAMPPFSYVQMVRYGNVLLAIGSGGGETAYSNLYVSADNGITWHLQPDNYSMVEAVKGSTETITMTVCSNCVYLVQSGGKVWKGVK